MLFPSTFNFQPFFLRFSFFSVPFSLFFLASLFPIGQQKFPGQKSWGGALCTLPPSPCLYASGFDHGNILANMVLTSALEIIPALQVGLIQVPVCTFHYINQAPGSSQKKKRIEKRKTNKQKQNKNKRKTKNKNKTK